MAFDETEGLTIRYQGKLCAVVFEYSRSVGLEPSHGCVFMELEDLGALEVKEIVPPALKGQPLKSQEKTTPDPGQRGLQSAGRLEFIEVFRNDQGTLERKAAVFENILVTEKAIEVSYANDDARNEIAKVEITDIRYLWGSRGALCCWINVPKPVDAEDANVHGTAEAAKEAHDLLAETARQIEAAARQIPDLKNLAELAKGRIESDKKALDKSLAELAQEGLLKVAKTPTEVLLFFASPLPKIAEALGLDLPNAASVAAKVAPKAQAAKQAEVQYQADKENLRNLEDELAKVEADLALNQALVEKLQREQNEATAKAKSQEKPILTSESVELIPSSTDEGKPWTVRRVLEAKILPELWGAPTLKRIPADVAQAIVGAKYWDPVLPKKALQEVLDEFQLVFALNADSTCSVWKKNEGELREEGDVGKIASDVDASVDPRVAATRQLVNFSRVPEVVLVLGAPTIKSARERLVPVGVRGGKIVPLEEALEGIGLTIEAAEKFAFLTHEHRSALSGRLGLFEDGLREFERWAFKWFQLKGGVEENSERLPILNARGAFGRVGELLPPRVFANGHTVIATLEAASLAAPAKTVAAAGGQGARKAFVVAALAAIKAAGTDKLNAVVNIPFSEQASGYAVMPRTGIVEFGAVLGPATPEGASMGTCRLNSAEIRVELEFCYQMRPGYKLGAGVSFDQRYAAAFVRDERGQAVQRPQVPAGTSPLLVHRPDLQLVEHLDGRSNKVILDKVAKALAQHQFDVALPKRGAVVECCRPVQVELNGSVLSATWAVNDEIPSTTAHVGSFAPLAPAPRLATRAFSDFGRLDRLAKDSVFAPRGLSE
jgi:hypothetical protein